MTKVIEYNGKKLEIYVIQRLDFKDPYYDYKVYEIVNKKHWWQFSRNEIICGSTFWWSDKDNFEEKIMSEIKQYFEKVKKQENFQNDLKKFFNN